LSFAQNVQDHEFVHNAWEAVASTIKKNTHCQTFAAFQVGVKEISNARGRETGRSNVFSIWQVVHGQTDVLECLYPRDYARVDVGLGGILKLAMENKNVVNVHNSLDDRRVLAATDNLDFLGVLVSVHAGYAISCFLELLQEGENCAYSMTLCTCFSGTRGQKGQAAQVRLAMATATYPCDMHFTGRTTATGSAGRMLWVGSICP